MTGPSRVVLTDHAAERATRYGVPFSEVSDLILELNHLRTSNPGPADWQVRRGRLVVAYSWPDRGDALTARAITLWIEE